MTSTPGLPFGIFQYQIRAIWDRKISFGIAKNDLVLTINLGLNSAEFGIDELPTMFKCFFLIYILKTHLKYQGQIKDVGGPGPILVGAHC